MGRSVGSRGRLGILATAVAVVSMVTSAPALAPDAPGVDRIVLRPLLEGRQWLADGGTPFDVTVEADDANGPRLPEPEAAPPVPPRTDGPAPAGGARTLRVPALLYHYVSRLPPDPDRVRIDLTVSPQDFEEHLRYLKEQRHTTITATDLWRALEAGGPLPARAVLLTFDDGYADAYSVVLPLLLRYGMTGTFFITLNLVGRPGYLTRDQVRVLADAGMDVQSHAVDHVALRGLPPATQRYQLCTAQSILSEWTGREVRHFAYPSGSYDDAAFAALRSCGFQSAYWTAGGSLQRSDRMLLLHRERVHGQGGLGALLLALSR